jgi:hypothetical protein
LDENEEKELKIPGTKRAYGAVGKIADMVF